MRRREGGDTLLHRVAGGPELGGSGRTPEAAARRLGRASAASEPHDHAPRANYEHQDPRDQTSPSDARRRTNRAGPTLPIRHPKPLGTPPGGFARTSVPKDRQPATDSPTGGEPPEERPVGSGDDLSSQGWEPRPPEVVAQLLRRRLAEGRPAGPPVDLVDLLKRKMKGYTLVPALRREYDPAHHSRGLVDRLASEALLVRRPAALFTWALRRAKGPRR